MSEKKIFVNGKCAIPNQLVSHRDTVMMEDRLLQQGTQYYYYAFHKPRGIECTTNPLIPDSIVPFFPKEHLYLVGRLDKASEGLIFMTDDDAFYKAIVGEQAGCEKEYYVETDLPLSEEDLQQLRQGVKILGRMTNPCEVYREGDSAFRIILTQGLNRQIRRMCHKRERQVTLLRRIRIGSYYLGSLPAGETKALKEEEIRAFMKPGHAQ